MTKKDITRKLYTDFSDAELQMLGEKPVTTIQKMAHEDRIVLDNSLLDYLRDFFNGIFDGEPIPKVFSNALIECRAPVAMTRLYVTFPENKPDWVYIDVFQDWTYLGKLLYPNVKMDDSERTENGQFYTFTPFLTINRFLTADIQQVLITAAKDIFTYAYLYVQANKEEKILFKEEAKVIPGQNNKKNKKSNKKKHTDAEIRDKVFVPTRRVYTLQKTEKTERALCEYVYSRWKVRGYSYTRKDGRVINVKEHYAFRHFPNQGIDKTGTDFILRKGDVVS